MTTLRTQLQLSQTPQIPHSPKKIKVIALSSYNCIFNKFFFDKELPSYQRVLVSNAALIEKWVSDIKASKPDLVLFTIFSNEQSERQHRKTTNMLREIDPNIKKTFYQAVLTIRTAVQTALATHSQTTACLVCPILLADVFSGSTPYTAFHLYEAAAKGHSVDYHPESIFDASRFLTLYYQTQFISSFYPGASIDYHAYDAYSDHKKPSALTHLASFLEQQGGENLTLIPKSTLLTLHEYKGDKQRALAFQGKGNVDLYFEDTIIKIVRSLSSPKQSLGDCYNKIFNICAELSSHPDVLEHIKQFILTNNMPRENTVTENKRTKRHCASTSRRNYSKPFKLTLKPIEEALEETCEEDQTSSQKKFPLNH